MFLLASGIARCKSFFEDIIHVQFHLSEIPPLYERSKDVENLQRLLYAS